MNYLLLTFGKGLDSKALLRRGLIVEYASLGWMTLEGALAIASGLLAGSLALLAFGGDSMIELISSLAVASYLRKMDRGWIGLESKEGLTERITLSLLVLLIPVIGLGGLYSYLMGLEPEATLLGVATALGAVMIMPFLWIEKKRIGEATDCLPLKADAVESETCFLMSLALLSGLLVNYIVHVTWADYAATVIILAFVAKEVLELRGAG